MRKFAEKAAFAEGRNNLGTFLAIQYIYYNNINTTYAAALHTARQLCYIWTVVMMGQLSG